ncbi:sigma-70 family RNA polymerase sigma factor [Candidatus Poribacteria bacterium]|nr:sigma-70 family RNA polymerase sigma factor [Candidatus Poribacteria bacterium]MYK96093.1 sigma-70 family RNA polymerase sigma factor [Candidatus Poribacteria bacterium]
MQQSDAQLIHRVLHGDQEAFSPLVKKYQKGVHALAWRKIGDFHIAQELTQDAFLKAYRQLRTLKDHNAFGGWLYVIVARECLDYLRRNRIPMESLDTADSNEVDKVSYSQYVAEKQEEEADETRREVVKELLKKLPESERTVMTLHYLGEMTIKAISEFLGVSQNTVKSRLSRARNRLRKEEDVIQQNLGSFQLPDNLAENIMQEVSRIAPVPPAVSKPVAPLAISAACAVLIFLMIGVGTPYLSRFQKPYSLNATSEPTVELIDAVFVVDTPAKPAVRYQPGSSHTPGKRPGAGQKSDASLFDTLPVDTTEVSTPKSQWNQTKGPEGGVVNNLFMASNGDVYARSGTDLYRLTNDRSTWIPANTDVSIKGSWQMAEHEDTLYIVSDTETLASVDRGETWRVQGARPKGALIDTVITDEALYLGLVDGVFHSVDAGKSWTSLDDRTLADREIRAITAIENTVFVGTDKGLYRHSSEGWAQLRVGETGNIRALTSAEHRLYVAVGNDVQYKILSMTMSISSASKTSLSLYRSTDLGDSWQAIDFVEMDSDSEENGWFSFSHEVNKSQVVAQTADNSGLEKTSRLKMVAAQERLLVLDGGKSYYSSDAGETWVSLDLDTLNMADTFVVVLSGANTFYTGGRFGIQRTTDAGETWHPFNTGLVRTSVDNLVYANHALYATIWKELVVSFDGGESWAPVLHRPEMLMNLMKFNDMLYVKGVKGTSPQLFRVSAEDNELVPVPEMPSLVVSDIETLIREKFENVFLESVQDELEKNAEERTELTLEDLLENFDLDKLSAVGSQTLEESMVKFMLSYFGSFAVSGSTYYMEYNQKLFRWKSGMTEWFDTGLADSGESIDSIAGLEEQGSMDFKIAVSGETVYVGKRDGHLLQSFDEGDTWNDVTTALPFSVTQFKAIGFAGPTLYVATDKGVMYSSDGIRWHTAIDAEGARLVIKKMAIDGTTVYGATEQQIYQLKENSNTWEPVTPEVPSKINSFTVDGRTLYVGTPGHGVLRFTLN